MTGFARFGWAQLAHAMRADYQLALRRERQWEAAAEGDREVKRYEWLAALERHRKTALVIAFPGVPAGR